MDYHCTGNARHTQNNLKDRGIDNRISVSLRSTLLDFRSSMSSLFNAKDQPSVTFFYFHLVLFLCCMLFPLFSMHQAYQANQYTTDFTVSDIIQFVVFFVQNCYVIGMRLLAIKMIDPYGDDVEDISAMTLMKNGDGKRAMKFWKQSIPKLLHDSSMTSCCPLLIVTTASRRRNQN